MSALPHASGLPAPNHSRSGAGAKKGAFPPRPKSVRVWAVLDPEANPSQSEPTSSTPGKQLGQEKLGTSGPDAHTAKSPLASWALLFFGVLLAFGLAVLLGNYLGK